VATGLTGAAGRTVTTGDGFAAGLRVGRRARGASVAGVSGSLAMAGGGVAPDAGSVPIRPPSQMPAPSRIGSAASAMIASRVPRGIGGRCGGVRGGTAGVVTPKW
jgi:hypothetical protein